MATVVELIKKLEHAPQELKEIFYLILEEMEKLKDLVTKKEFNELKDIVKELAEAQKKTEQRLDSLTLKVEELAEPQKRTEIELQNLIGEHKETRRILRGLTATVGYGLEDNIFPYLERFIQDELGFKIIDLGRKNIIYPDGKFDEINIYIEAEKDDEKAYFIGECKVQPGKKDIKKFSDTLNRVRNFLNKKVYGFIVAYSIQPAVEEYLKKYYPEIKFYYSFHFVLKYKK